ncbi:MAG: helix-turn-helix domain-containing protein [Lachnospiraceae bacterium]
MKATKIAMTINEASQYTGIGRNNLRKLVSLGKIPHINVGRKVLVRTDVLEVFLNLNEGKNLKNVEEIIEL